MSETEDVVGRLYQLAEYEIWGNRPYAWLAVAAEELTRLRASVQHWKDHAKAVDAICDDHGIPTHHESTGDRIYTEDRVRLLVAKLKEGA